MAQFTPCGWALSEYKDLFDWSLELANIKLSTVEKNRTTLLNMAEMIRDLGALLKAEELVAEEVASSVGTCSKGKGHKPKVVQEPEEEDTMICWYVMQLSFSINITDPLFYF